MADVIEFKKPDVLGGYDITVTTRNGAPDSVYVPEGVPLEDLRQRTLDALWAIGNLEKVPEIEQTVAVILVLKSGRTLTVAAKGDFENDTQRDWLQQWVKTAVDTICHA